MRNGLKRIMAILIATLILLGALPASALETESSNVVVPGIDLFSIVDPDQNPVTTYVFYNGNEVVSTQSVKNGETLYEPQAQEKDGMVFEGWYTEQQGGERFDRFGDVTVDQDETVNLYARYATAYYVYFYNPDGSKLMHTETVSDHAAHKFSGVTYDTGDPTTGVVGWANEPNGTEDVSGSVAVPEGATSVSLYAIIETGYWVTFNTNGGSAVDPVFVRSGSLDVSQSQYVPTRAGYEFDGWFASEDFSGSAVNEVETATTLYAKWNPERVNLSIVFWYENANDEEYSYAGTAIAQALTGSVVTSEDYKEQRFDGRDSEHFTYNGEEGYVESKTVAGDGSTILNVYFTRNEYTLTFKSEGNAAICGKDEHQHDWYCEFFCPYGYEHTHRPECYGSGDVTITAKYQADIRSHFPIKEGSETVWWTVPEGCDTFRGGTYLGSIDTMPGENITFEKHDTQSGAVVAYYVETLGDSDGVREYGGRKFNLYKDIEMEGGSYYLTYTEEFHDITGFTQWRSVPEFDKYEQGGVTREIRDGETAYLYYTRNNYTLRFYNYNAELTDEAETVQYEAPIANLAGAVVPDCPEGLDPSLYEFEGWYTDQYFMNQLADDATMPANDMMLYAKWVPRTFTVRFNLNYVGAQDAPVDQTVAAYAKAVEPEDPSRDGFVFTGWYRDSKCTEPFSFDTQITEDITIYAGWYTSESYHVTYHTNYGVEPEATFEDPTVYDYDASAKIKGVRDFTFAAPTDRPYFLGWATRKDGAAVYQPGALLDISENESLADETNTIHLYAVWGAQPGTTTLTYVANYEGANPRQKLHLIDGSSNLPNNTTLTLYGLEEAGFSRPGYEFLGWAEDPTATEAKYQAKAEVLVDNLGEGENILYAVWKQSAVDVTIEKQVTGNMGDRTKAFGFEVTSTEPIGAPTEGEYKLSTDGMTATFSLTNGVSVILQDVPIGATLTITETDASGYTMYINGTPVEGNTYTGTYLVSGEGENKVTVENNKEARPDTGIVTDSLPYIVILACVVAIGAVVIVRRRGRRDE